ncbi:hypothetical protein AHAS_Ahas16G0220500 [Arachis hypogaea]|uniref:NET domain-containing protein n=1 Tax=Arachis hypogaea TaxID=3818 RepID=A0A444YRI8_ARAHY|nr:hypothetical protein Ahy_B06g084283 isoform B [Arachis hypogaea]
MLEAQPVLFRRIPLRRRMLKPSVGTEDRGWTSLHVCARKGDLKLSFPPEKMEQVIQIIRKRNGNLKQDEDDIELDIEAVDTETL